MTPIYLAHVHPETLAPHTLPDHLRDTAKLARAYLAGLGMDDWINVAALWHDLGKYREAFQQYIRDVSGYDAHVKDSTSKKTDHSTAGALLAWQRMPDVRGRILAYLIASHHTGLLDWFGDGVGGPRPLEKRLASGVEDGLLAQALAADIPDDILNPPMPTLVLPCGVDGLHLWVRILFSSLVDADFLDTERFMNIKQSGCREHGHSISQLRALLDQHLAAKAAALPQPLTEVNVLRAEVLQQCLDRAAEPPGLFSLTVPTGGGKTLSSLAFALKHADIHSKRRIIYAIPYTSIIEQTAGVFREALGDVVLEHHSSFDPDKETPFSRLAAENWDAPLIVTTNVQLFESLFAARTSRCRKLHNLINSVIVLDEAQLLPPDLLAPILHCMRELSARYGVTWVLCTATQPALGTRRNGHGKVTLQGLDGVRDIIPDPRALFERLDRVEVELPADLNQPTDWPTLADELAGHQQALVVVNTRSQARELFQHMPEGTHHLSALMCGEHRSQILAQIRAQLALGEPVRIVSTSLIEAGVDIDLPVVYRALAGLDSIAQAAGRCNREGRLSGKGRLVVFVPPAKRLVGLAKYGEQATRSVLHRPPAKLLSPEAFRLYFDAYYGQIGQGLDKHQILQQLKQNAGEAKIPFRTVAEQFSLIDESQSISVIVPYVNPDKPEADSRPLIAMLASGNVHRELTRHLQRFAVSLRRYEFDLLKQSGEIDEPLSGYFVLKNETMYHPKLGVCIDQRMGLDPERFVT
ncbi:CRISPR-associated endonuclease/helicase Cas3 [Chitinivorax tropicus]|uniref:CRISPR-associated endonuclease/helicase Cas3 n=1 Tax=Chitinivorax tropicus TaxID=714531 RepID=A0A840MF09_9PROT|nr:CRISPR-associated helicase Cas3' [Chitinivorax tropicus]MBB5016980.1 CRISPR-associated endonuclease/helicase Cas3 [Chitinivorax tropicus]